MCLLGCRIERDYECNQEIKASFSKASQEFFMLKHVWRSAGLTFYTKNTVFRSNHLSVIQDRLEWWKIPTATDVKQVLKAHPHNRLTRLVSSKDMQNRAGMSSVEKTTPV